MRDEPIVALRFRCVRSSDTTKGVDTFTPPMANATMAGPVMFTRPAPTTPTARTAAARALPCHHRLQNNHHHRLLRPFQAAPTRAFSHSTVTVTVAAPDPSSQCASTAPTASIAGRAQPRHHRGHRRHRQRGVWAAPTRAIPLTTVNVTTAATEPCTQSAPAAPTARTAGRAT